MPRAPIIWPRLISGRASSERVSGSSGLSNLTASLPTSRAIRAFWLAMHQPIMEVLPNFSWWPRLSMVRPASPVPACRMAHCPVSSTRYRLTKYKPNWSLTISTTCWQSSSGSRMVAGRPGDFCAGQQLFGALFQDGSIVLQVFIRFLEGVLMLPGAFQGCGTGCP